MAERRDNKKRILWKGEYQKNDGRYMYKYIDVEGNNRFVYSWTLTQTDRTPKGKKHGKCLRELEKEIEKDLQDGVNWFYSQNITLNDYYISYMSDRKDLKISTRTSYQYKYEKYVKKALGYKKLATIKYSDIKSFYTHLLMDLDLKYGSIMTIHSILHPIFEIAVRDNLIRVNPTNNIVRELRKTFKWESEKRHALTKQEQKVLIEFLRSNKVYKKWLPIVTVLLGTGCRIGEIIGLTWNDCDFKKNIIHINHNMIYKPDEDTRKMKFYISTPKTKAGERDIPMLTPVREALLHERMRQMEDGFNKFEIDGYSGFIFSNRNGTPIDPTNFDKVINRIVKCYNEKESLLSEKEHREPVFLPHFSAHNLRHTFCTRMCENEKDLKIIQEIMGHSDIFTTMNIYNEATLERKTKSFSELEDKILIG